MGMEPAASTTPGRFVVPGVVATHFHLRPGDTVADFGTGQGFFLPILSELVGPKGRVFACEIQRNLVEAIGETVRTKSLGNVEPLWCDIEAHGGTKIDDQALDVAIMVNTLFQIEDKVTAVKEMSRTLRPGGKLFVVDWSESFGGLGPQPTQVITESNAKDLIEAEGFVFERSYDAGGHHYGLGFRKP